MACLVDTINRKGHFSKLSQASLRVMKEEHCLQMMSPHNLQWCLRRRTPKLLWHFMQRFSSLSCFQGTTLRSKSVRGRRERGERGGREREGERRKERGREREGERKERERREGRGRRMRGVRPSLLWYACVPLIDLSLKHLSPHPSSFKVCYCKH